MTWPDRKRKEMKILICGKGGSGKSTLSALVALTLRDMGANVLLVDADESNYGLHRLMGVPMPMSLLDDLGGKMGFRQKMNAVPRGMAPQVFEKMALDDIPETCVADAGGVKMVVVGKIHHFGEGCACPIGVLSKTFLSKLDTDKKDAVIIDAEAGVEHFGRRVDAECDMVLGVIDPTYESFLLAKKMKDMAGNAEIPIFFVLNKADETVESAMARHLDGMEVIAKIPYMKELFQSGLEGNPLEIRMPEIEPICERILGEGLD